jgi:hypothetical protein
MKRKMKQLPIPSDPDLRKIYYEILEEKRAGTYWEPPRSKKACKTLEDIWHYVGKLAHLDSRQMVLVENGAVKRVVWSGGEFNDKKVNIVEEILPMVQPENGLEEIRLVATRVSSAGVDRLCRLFPRARVTIFTEEDLFTGDCRLTSASFVITPPRTA